MVKVSQTTQQEMVQKADEDITNIVQQLHDLQEQIRLTQEQIAQIEQQQEALRATAERERLNADRLRVAHEQAQTYANFAVNTPAEQGAITALNAVKKDADASETILAEAIHAHEDYTQQATAQLATLHTTLAEQQSRYQALTDLHTTIRDMREQAHTALGQETYARIEMQLQALKEQAVLDRSALIDTRIALKEALNAALETLTPWPLLRSQVLVAFDAYEDSTTRLLNAYIAFLDIVERDGPNVERMIGRHNTLALCELSFSDLAQMIDRRGLRDQHLATQKREQARQSLALYIKAMSNH